MEMNMAALANIICATRASIRLAKVTQELLYNKGALTEADEIAGRLKDALYYLSDGIVLDGKELDSVECQKYIDKLLNSAIPDLPAAETLMKKCVGQKQETPVDQCTFKGMWDSLGLYLYKAVNGENDSR